MLVSLDLMVKRARRDLRDLSDPRDQEARLAIRELMECLDQKVRYLVEGGREAAAAPSLSL